MNNQPQDRYIFHIAPRSQWEQAKDQEGYRAETQESEGFLHCSTIHQVLAVANSYFHGHKDMVLLLIEPSKVLAPIKYEGSTSETYPHIYGPINHEAVVAVYDFLPDEHGKFSLPQEVRNLRES